jgi:hypothetical protein
MGVSILLFVCFEIANMFFMNRIAAEKLELATTMASPTNLEEVRAAAQTFDAANARFRQRTLTTARRVHRAWLVFFWPSLLSGVFAALLLIFLLIKHTLVNAF